MRMKTVAIFTGFAVTGAVLALLVRVGNQGTIRELKVTSSPPVTVGGATEPRRGRTHIRRGSALGTTVSAADLDVIGSTDPRSKDYDPVTISTVTGKTPVSIMNNEPRDPAFAVPREAAL